MPRINTDNPTERWRWACPHPQRHTDWRVTDGCFECRSCKETYQELVDRKTGERVSREEIEVVGPESDSKGRFGRPRVDGEGV